jgi:hypothetical protein
LNFTRPAGPSFDLYTATLPNSDLAHGLHGVSRDLGLTPCAK